MPPLGRPLLLGALLPAALVIVAVAGAGTAIVAILGALTLAWAVLAGLTLRRRLRALEERAPFSQALVQGVGDGVCAFDHDGRLLLMNPGAESILGVAAAAVAGKPLGELLPGIAAVEPEAPASEPVRAEIELAAAGGRRRSILTHTLPVLSRGATVGSVVTLSDVSERRAAERERAVTEQRLGEIVERAADPLLLHDRDGHILHVNSALCRALDYERAELLALPLADIDPEWQTDGAVELLSGQDPDTAVTIEGRLRRRDGSALPVETRVRWLGDEPRLLLRLARDVSERTRAESIRRSTLQTALDCVVTMDETGAVVEFNPAAERAFGYSAVEIVGRPLSELIIPPRLRAAHESGLAGAAEAARRGSRPLSRRFEITAMRADGSEFPVEVSIARVADDPPLFTGFIRDLTEVRRTRDQLARRVAQQTAVAALGEEALRGTAIGPLIDHACAVVAETLHCQLTAVFEPAPGEDALLLRSGIGWRRGALGRERVPAAETHMLGHTLAQEQPTVVADIRVDRRFTIAPLVREHGAASGVSVPIGGTSRAQGVLAAYNTSPRRFSSEDLNFLQAIGALLGTAIERDRVARDVRRQHQRISQLASERGRLVAETLEAEDRERQRVSESLHDESLQELFFVRQELEEARARDGQDDEHLRLAVEGIDRTIAQLRGLLADLHPAALQQLGLEHALRAVAQRQGALGRYVASVRVGRGAAGIHDQLLLSLARELLVNAAKHAQASEVAVSVERESEQLVLTVEDDGRGIDPESQHRAVLEGHIGLASAAQRVQAVGGELTIESAPGEGTRVRVEVPLQPSASALDDAPGRVLEDVS